MKITIYLDREGKCRQVLQPVKPPECSIESIVSTVTRGDYHRFEVSQ